ncbi:MAG: 2-C-methyl-D-erythritol 4-phosphate cytidylyltransferase [Hydrogenophilus thermoluteolus]
MSAVRVRQHPPPAPLDLCPIVVTTHTRTFAVIPAAGIGARMSAALPKQYLPFAGAPLLVRTLSRILRVAWIERCYVVLAPDDRYWDTLVTPHLAQLPPAFAVAERLRVVRLGGTTRAHSVRAGLRVAHAEGFGDDDWALVHDAARPCLTPETIEHLQASVGNSNVGGLIAIPATDTVKVATPHTSSNSFPVVERTVPRERIWLAQTPQLFRLAVLRQALDRFPDATDEASAVERLGLQPILVKGHWSNLKVTLPGDLELAQAIWSLQEDSLSDVR